MTKRLVFSSYASNLSELERALEAASVAADEDATDRGEQVPFGDIIDLPQVAVALIAETLADGSVVYNLSIEDAPLGVTAARIRPASSVRAGPIVATVTAAINGDLVCSPGYLTYEAAFAMAAAANGGIERLEDQHAAGFAMDVAMRAKDAEANDSYAGMRAAHLLGLAKTTVGWPTRARQPLLSAAARVEITTPALALDD